MTVSNQTNKTRQHGNGSTVTFNFSFLIQDEANLKIYIIDTTTVPETSVLKTITTDYTVIISTTGEGGSVTMVATPTSDEDVFIKRVLPFTQNKDLGVNINFPEKGIEDELDKSRMIDIQVNEETDRTLRLNEFTESTTNLELPEPVASKVIGFDSTGLLMALFSGSDLDTILTTAFGQQLVQSANALTARNFLELGVSNNVQFNNIIGNQITGTTYVGLPSATITSLGVKYLNKVITLTNGTDTAHDINFGAGVFNFNDGTGQAVLSAITKRIDATWAVGTGNGGLFTGSVANSTWYYLWAIYNPTTGISDAGFDTSSTGANAPAGYTKKKRIGACLTNGSANILNGTWTENYFEFIEPIAHTFASPAVASNNLAIEIPPITKIKAYVKFWGEVSVGVGDILDVAIGKKTETLANTNLDMKLIGDSSRYQYGYKHIPCVDGEIKYEVFASATTRTLKIFAYGYTDYNL